ncbi:MAG: tRNA pseudouridine(38-40) synthase TruA [Candidatus Rokubacteria bacterium]|nr:tRNA pseudouridine(38-40) synthase TruA [Candidatus Rokubacteria bacterium]
MPIRGSRGPDGRHSLTSLALLLAYDGAAYRGWQVQADAPTVQGTVAEALAPLAGGPVRLTGASRTDAGVHALGQVASFAVERALAPAVVHAALNATLPRDIRVLAARAVPPGFDARRSARLKRYGYLIVRAPVAVPFLRGYACHVPRPVDVAAMRAALAALRGKRDFSAFQAAAGRDRAPVCRVYAARLCVRGGLLGLFLSADAFLHHMVRNVVGTLLEVGQGRRPVEWVAEVLEGRDRRRAGPTAPALGLYLLGVRYAFPLFPGGGRLRRPP